MSKTRRLFAIVAATLTGTGILALTLAGARLIDDMDLGVVNGLLMLGGAVVSVFGAQMAWRAVAKGGDSPSPP